MQRRDTKLRPLARCWLSVVVYRLVSNRVTWYLESWCLAFFTRFRFSVPLSNAVRLIDLVRTRALAVLCPAFRRALSRQFPAASDHGTQVREQGAQVECWRPGSRSSRCQRVRSKWIMCLQRASEPSLVVPPVASELRKSELGAIAVVNHGILRSNNCESAARRSSSDDTHRQCACP